MFSQQGLLAAVGRQNGLQPLNKQPLQLGVHGVAIQDPQHGLEQFVLQPRRLQVADEAGQKVQRTLNLHGNTRCILHELRSKY